MKLIVQQQYSIENEHNFNSVVKQKKKSKNDKNYKNDIETRSN
jgi:hypothetical protein